MPSLSAAEGADDVNLVGRLERDDQMAHLLLIHKQLDVLTDLVLLGDDAETKTRQVLSFGLLKGKNENPPRLDKVSVGAAMIVPHFTSRARHACECCACQSP